ncbi:hypothetical protein Nepgr_007561 [Nepenthes gracilis]|uniref:F-box domain-containing protein n=1 Tax=Nepenthes gracilis TaxID=150966 RepID=A0AAD3S7X2_NEPGR|nr:hypothetical protein Nepgr_007561 [Nepenthes gracilis]
MAGRKKQKLVEEQGIDGARDIISGLPDCILQHILSFLPTKDAVATCILSTRWTYLWTAIPNIDLDDSLIYFGEVDSWYPIERVSFMNFVERVLIHRDVSSMNKFRLSCTVCFYASRVNAWISAAIRHNVKELDLQLDVEKPFMLPHCVYTCESLEVLKIEMECVLKLPSSISLPNLKTLHLCLVTFSDENSLHRLFSSCHVLQELSLSDCDWRDMTNVTISIPTLKNLKVEDLPYCLSLNESSGCVIKVNAPNLVYLEYFGDLPNEILLANQLSLANASVQVCNLSERQSETACRAVKLLQGLQYIKCLKISAETIKTLGLAENSLDHLPVFQNLTHMELSVEIESHTFEALLEFLQGIHPPEFLSFPEGLDPPMCLCKDEWVLTSASSCSLSNLKTINLQNLCGTETELNILKSLLKRAPIKVESCSAFTLKGQPVYGFIACSVVSVNLIFSKASRVARR